MLLHVIARGKIGRSPEAELFERYAKRISWPFRHSELPEGAVVEVEVNYLGKALSTGDIFDSSFERGESISFPVGAGQLIEGWDTGLVGMKEGGRRQLLIPGDLAYGPAGSPPDIGPDDTLVFVIDLLSVTA